MLFASLLPPSTRQPGPIAVLLGQTLKLSLIFSPISHSLGVNRETSYLESAVIYQNIHLHPVFKGDPAVDRNPAIIW